MHDNHASNPTYERIAKILRLTFVAAIVLLAAGGGTASVDTHVSRGLTLAGYVVFAVELVLLTGMQLHFFPARATLHASSRKVLRAALATCPFLAVRTVYGLLEVATAGDAHSVWNPLTGSAVAFALMGLLPEYVVLCGYVVTGYSIPARREVDQQRLDEPGKV